MRLIVGAGIISAFASSFAQGRVDAIYGEFEDQILKKVDYCWHTGQYERAISLLYVMRGVDPTDADISENIIFMLGNVGRKDEALVEAMRFHQAAPSDAHGAESLAQMYLQAKLFARIPAILEPHIGSAENLSTFAILGRAYEEMGLLRESLRIWELRIKNVPDDANAKRHVDRLRVKLQGG